jgi:hypothetical protein
MGSDVNEQFDQLLQRLADRVRPPQEPTIDVDEVADVVHELQRTLLLMNSSVDGARFVSDQKALRFKEMHDKALDLCATLAYVALRALRMRAGEPFLCLCSESVGFELDAPRASIITRTDMSVSVEPAVSSRIAWAGPLLKKSAHLKKWRKRWFIALRNPPALIYFKTQAG